MSFKAHLNGKEFDVSVFSESGSERESDGTRKKLYDDDPEPIKVFLRIRDYTADEARQQLQTINLKPESSGTLVVSPPDFCPTRGGNSLKFHFTRIYEPSVGQQQLYHSALYDVVKEFVVGANFLAFNYGVTNAGKTYTMQGTPQQPGLIPRALDTIFTLLQGKISPKIRLKPHHGSVVKLGPAEVSSELRLKEDVMNRDFDSTAASIFMDTLNASTMQREMSLNFSTASSMTSGAFSSKSSSLSSFDFTQHSLNADGETPYSIWVSFVEVYNEVVFDLLENIKNGKRTSLKVCERGNGNVFIKGAREICVFSAEEAYRVLLVGQKNLRYAATKLNHNSSRSHCLFTIKLLAVQDSGPVTVSGLSFCDLAGAERAAKTQSRGDRLREAGLINTSLLVLGRCFETLRANQKLGKDNCLPIPFRESKLTRILQNNFTGKARALMIVNISPCSNMYGETMHVLKFSAIASEVVLSPSSDLFVQDVVKPTKCSLALLRRSLNDRESLPWESSKADEESGGLSSQRSSTIFEEGEDEDWESDGDEQKLVDYKKKSYELLDLAQKLSDRLKKERADKLQMEIDIREELTEEFQARITQLHEFYQEQMDQIYDEAEDLADKRMEIYDEFYRSAKRVRRRSDDMPRDSGTVEEPSLGKGARITELEAEVRVLQNENEVLKEDLRKTVQSEVDKQEQLTALHFRMAEVRREADCHTLEKQIDVLKHELETARASLASQEKLVAEMISAAAAQAERLEEEKKNSMELAEQLLKDFEKVHGALLLLCKGEPKSSAAEVPAVRDEDEERRRQLSRRTVYFSASSSAHSSSETPKSTESGSQSAEAAPAGDEISQPFAAPCSSASESPAMPVLSPQVLAASVPDEVFEEAAQPCSVTSGSGCPEVKAATGSPAVDNQGTTEDELEVSRFQNYQSLTWPKEAASFADVATSPIAAAMEDSERETLLRRIKELEEIVAQGKSHLERRFSRLPTPTHEKEDIENRAPKTEKKKSARKDKFLRSSTRGPAPHEDSSIDEITVVHSSKKKTKVPLPKRNPGLDPFLCSPVKDPSIGISPDIQAQVMRKLRRRK